jgi:hypothetical protein
MRNIWQEIAKHPISIIFYLIYSGVLISCYLRGQEYERMLKLHGNNWPHGVREDGLLPFIYAFIFGLVIGGFAIGAKENKFYLWLLPFIIIPIIILGNIS